MEDKRIVNILSVIIVILVVIVFYQANINKEKQATINSAKKYNISSLGFGNMPVNYYFDIVTSQPKEDTNKLVTHKIFAELVKQDNIAKSIIHLHRDEINDQVWEEFSASYLIKDQSFAFLLTLTLDELILKDKHFNKLRKIEASWSNFFRITDPYIARGNKVLISPNDFAIAYITLKKELYEIANKKTLEDFRTEHPVARDIFSDIE
ncbi:hypothetical protein [Desulfuribacillus alkaliarsenatis]|uniref:Uncharacterized protein n=1 Tax=Desulfuribacillus alkaliarsenatis TaxID=766136 RepID=A0A1E5G3F4_9FIRM|nr:hypothetical protein [Desulfuribacillus alkaliarsenatis]OEF97590.1 hypothetical protein BHF68_14740 [Desulfuribacillus alkaliarsenatis]